MSESSSSFETIAGQLKGIQTRYTTLKKVPEAKDKSVLEGWINTATSDLGKMNTTLVKKLDLNKERVDFLKNALFLLIPAGTITGIVTLNEYHAGFQNFVSNPENWAGVIPPAFMAMSFLILIVGSMAEVYKDELDFDDETKLISEDQETLATQQTALGQLS